MGWREYLHLYQKYEGDISLATEREIEHADRGIDPATARQIAEADYKRKKRTKDNDSNKENHKTNVGDKRFADSLF